MSPVAILAVCLCVGLLALAVGIRLSRATPPIVFTTSKVIDRWQRAPYCSTLDCWQPVPAHQAHCPEHGET